MKLNRQELRQIDPKTLKRHKDNPRHGDVAAIVASIKAHGFGRPAVVWAKDAKTILAGWHRAQAAIDAGLPKIPCILIDVDAGTARRIVLADNRTADRGGYDEKMLAELLGELTASGGSHAAGVTPEETAALVESALASVGYTPDELEEIVAAAAGAPDQSDQLEPVYQVTIDLSDADKAAELKADLETQGFQVALKTVRVSAE